MSGEPELALKKLSRYRSLAPFDPNYAAFEFMFTVAHTFKGDYEQAVAVGRRAVRMCPQLSSGYKPLIASLGHLGRHDEAKAYVDELLALEPEFTIKRFSRVYPFKKESDRDRYVEGLWRAGVPDCA